MKLIMQLHNELLCWKKIQKLIRTINKKSKAQPLYNPYNVKRIIFL